MIKKPRGTEDILFEESRKWRIVEKIMHDVAAKYHFEEIRTPYFESVDLYVRGVGQTSDVVSKEMYIFEDKKQRQLALRPEGTTGAIRAYIENKLFGLDNQPVKLYYLGPMFRYERPQKGRQRQFHQFGMETIGIKSPQVDVEVIMAGLSICQEVGLKNMKVLINTLGDIESRLEYRKVLVEYFKSYQDELCSDCQTRLELNPLRLLDCKIDGHKQFVLDAPVLADYLNDKSRKYFENVLQILDELHVEYEIDNRLVRGLDYYTDTIFEVVSTNPASGAQATIFGGGRYDGLVESLDGPDVSGVGFAIGIERLLFNIEEDNPDLFKEAPLDIYIMPLEEEFQNYSFMILEKLRANGIKADMEYEKKSLKAMLRYIQRNNIRYGIIIGEEEFNEKTLILKDFENNTQEKLSDTWLELIRERINNNEENTQ